MYASAFVLGFHGCDQSVGEKILAGKEPICPSANSYDWLGGGAYFGENSPERAQLWAEYVQAHPGNFKTKIEHPFVLGAIINLGRCLDLTEAASLEEVKMGYAEFHKTMATANLPMPQNEPGTPSDLDFVKRKLDCAVFQFVHDLRRTKRLDPFDTVRGAFFEGVPLYAGARIMARTHIQISVCNVQRCVLGYFRPIASAATG